VKDAWEKDYSPQDRVLLFFLLKSERSSLISVMKTLKSPSAEPRRPDLLFCDTAEVTWREGRKWGKDVRSQTTTC